jgi:hypothetical protein
MIENIPESILAFLSLLFLLVVSRWLEIDAVLLIVGTIYIQTSIAQSRGRL